MNRVKSLLSMRGVLLGNSSEPMQAQSAEELLANEAKMSMFVTVVRPQSLLSAVFRSNG